MKCTLFLICSSEFITHNCPLALNEFCLIEIISAHAAVPVKRIAFTIAFRLWILSANLLDIIMLYLYAQLNDS